MACIAIINDEKNTFANWYDRWMALSAQLFWMNWYFCSRWCWCSALSTIKQFAKKDITMPLIRKHLIIIFFPFYYLYCVIVLNMRFDCLLDVFPFWFHLDLLFCSIAAFSHEQEDTQKQTAKSKEVSVTSNREVFISFPSCLFVSDIGEHDEKKKLQENRENLNY